MLLMNAIRSHCYCRCVHFRINTARVLCTNFIKTSSSFFDASKSFFRITQTLEATCAVNESQCTATLDGYARELLADTACKTDYNNDNPIVIQAYNGLVAYKPSYQASCLRDDDGNYCKWFEANQTEYLSD